MPSNAPPQLKDQFDGQRLFLVGGGKMGMALLEGWLKAGIDAAQFMVQEPNPSPDLMASGVGLNPDAESLAAHAPDITILAVKPQIIDTVLPPLRLPDGGLVISLMAGVSVATLRALLGEATACIRTMPNTPAAIGQGMTGLFADAHVTDAQRMAAEALLAVVGQTVWLESEKMMDAVTAISGSGPAYLFHMVEALANGGVSLGLSEEMAEQLAVQTIIGAAAMLQQPDADARALRRDVTSAGGTTEAALDVLMSENGLSDLMRLAVQSAANRSRELAQGDEEPENS